MGRGKFNIHGRPFRFNKVSLVAGGSGITPILQIMRAVAADKSDRTQISLLFANHTPDGKQIYYITDVQVARFLNEIM